MTPAPEPLWRPDPASAETRAAWRACPRRLLLVVPHPDDESYGPAGTLARYGRDPDCAVGMLFLTSGEAATIGKERGIERSDLALLREGRLNRVVEWLGVDALFLARLPDGGLARLPLTRLGASIRACLDQFEPQVVLGHDPRGTNAHPDHIASHWALRSALAGSSVRRFAMLALGEESVRAATPRLMFSTPRHRIHCTLELTAEEELLKERCLLEHEAVMTMDPARSAREGMPLRLPREECEFFGEPDGLVVLDLFHDLPETLPPV